MHQICAYNRKGSHGHWAFLPLNWKKKNHFEENKKKNKKQSISSKQIAKQRRLKKLRRDCNIGLF
jgi:hypothetical protein